MSGYTQFTRSFIATDPQGRSHTISVYTDYIETRAFQSPTPTLEGNSELRTDEGYAVNVLSKGKYQVVETGVILTSDDPNAF
jgi:hypothetical protein